MALSGKQWLQQQNPRVTCSAGPTDQTTGGNPHLDIQTPGQNADLYQRSPFPKDFYFQDRKPQYKYYILRRELTVAAMVSV